MEQIKQIQMDAEIEERELYMKKRTPVADLQISLEEDPTQIGPTALSRRFQGEDIVKKMHHSQKIMGRKNEKELFSKKEESNKKLIKKLKDMKLTRMEIVLKQQLRQFEK